MNNLHGVNYSELKGAERVEAMKYFRHIKNYTNTAIAELFGEISRERVRQLIGNTGTGFVTRRKKAIWEQNKHLTNAELAEALELAQHKSASARYREGERHAIQGESGLSINHDHVMYVSKLLNSKGIEHEPTPLRHPYDLRLANGLRVEVLSASPMHPFPNLSMYSFNTRQDVKGRFCDFFACVMSDTLNVFVIPAHLTRVNSPIRFCFPKDYGKISKWVQYHNRFDLLEAK